MRRSPALMIRSAPSSSHEPEISLVSTVVRIPADSKARRSPAGLWADTSLHGGYRYATMSRWRIGPSGVRPSGRRLSVVELTPGKPWRIARLLLDDASPTVFAS